MGMMRRRRLAPCKQCKNRTTDIVLNLTPLIDTAFSLVIILVVMAPIAYNSIKVNLPHGHSKDDESKKQSLVVSLDKGGAVYLNNVKMSSNALLLETLKKRVKGKESATVFIYADTVVSHGEVMKLIDNIRKVEGVKGVVFPLKAHAT
jgi:biopolymer transport protein ExbD